VGFFGTGFFDPIVLEGPGPDGVVVGGAVVGIVDGGGAGAGPPGPGFAVNWKGVAIIEGADCKGIPP
jgi:hypothetical protein